MGEGGWEGGYVCGWRWMDDGCVGGATLDGTIRW